jgi:hypothetical protein
MNWRILASYHKLLVGHIEYTMQVYKQNNTLASE